MAPPRNRNPGVSWNAQAGKWMGHVQDRSVRVGKTAKHVHVGYFADEQACADAVAAKLAEVNAANAQKLHALAQALEHTRNLPLRPKHPADAKPDTAYYGEKEKGAKGSGEPKEFGPTRYVRVADKSKSGGFDFRPCCIATLDSGAPCTSVVSHDGKHCKRHGGGFRVGEGRGNAVCTHCKTTRLWTKRHPNHGGNGLCPTCEAQLKAEADANGYEGPLQSLRWEEHTFNLLLPLLVYADGTPFPPEQRDERRGGGLGTSSTKKRRRECDTTTNRFPDGQWILRDEDGHAVLVLIVEVDEDSHGDRKPECESGKIDDTAWAVQQKLGFEGAARGARAPKRPMVPIVMIKVNPNAYDGPRAKLEDRVQAVADLFHSYAHLPASERAALPTHAPIVHVLYYHSKEGAKNLAHLATKAPEAGWTLTVH